MEQTNFCSG